MRFDNLLTDQAALAALSRGHVATILDQIHAAVSDWPRFAEAAGVAKAWRQVIDPSVRLRVLG